MTPDQLRTCRKNREQTREELAEDLGVSASAIVQWESGKRTIPNWVAEKMLSQVKIELPLEELELLLDYAKEHKMTFTELLGDAIRVYLKSPESGGNISKFPKVIDDRMIAEDGPEYGSKP